jgi:hypothetical protein
VWHRIRVEKSFAFEKADKGGARGHFNPRARYKGFEVIEVMPELLRRFPNLLAMATTA